MAKRKTKSATRKKPTARKSKKKVPRKTAANKKSDSKPSRPASLTRAKKELLPLLDALGDDIVKDTAITLANSVINDLILQPHPAPFTSLEIARFIASCNLSTKSVNGYASIDADHLAKIGHFIQSIETYVEDRSQKQPLNFLMLASPGSGKSHFIKCVARRLGPKKIAPVTFNMASLQSNDDLIPPLDAARNLKVEDKIPLLFLDEFDSNPNNFALLLPLLWDGALNVGQRDLRLGKVVIVLAGSDPALPETMDHARSMRQDVPITEGQSTKIVDLFSRINGGVLNIPPFVDVAKGIDRRADKICIAVHLLKSRFGDTLRTVPSALLRFIGQIQFRYGVRSVAHFVGTIPYKEKTQALTLETIGLPLSSSVNLKNSSLAYHFVDDDQALGVIKKWDEACKNSQPININHQLFSTFPFQVISQGQVDVDQFLDVFSNISIVE